MKELFRRLAFLAGLLDGLYLIAWSSGDFAFPHRFAALLLMVIVLLFYSLLPWPKPPAEGLYYSPYRAALLPDLVATVLGGLFFAIPIFVISRNASGGGLFSNGWAVLTAICWGLAALSFSIFFFSARCMALRLEITGETFKSSSLGHQTVHSLAEIDRVEAVRKTLPEALRRIIYLASFFNWRLAAQSLLVQDSEPGFDVVFRNGSHFCFYLSALTGAEPFLGRLRKAGIAIDPGVLESLDIDPEKPVFPEEFPRPGKNLAPLFALMFLLPPLLGLLYTTRPKEPLTVEPGSLGAVSHSIPEEEDNPVTGETLAKENEIIREMKKEQARMNQTAEKIKVARPEERAPSRPNSRNPTQGSTSSMSNLTRFEQNKAARST